MNDPAFNLLLPFIQDAPAHTLWLADENLLRSQMAPRSNIQMIANRLDLVQSAQERGWQADWSDFDFSAIAPGSIARVIYRVSKEKALVHHNINQALRVLQTGGELILSGDKGEGIKGYLDRTRVLFGGQAETEKASANCWRGVFTRPEEPGAALDDRDYQTLRPACRDEHFSYWSKPGVFGWDKIDKGSAFLMAQLDSFLAELDAPPQQILDLGCGYGYLSVQAARLGVPITATDNNAAAITACRRNFAELGIRGEVIAASCGAGIEGPFELILCNPPFHAGFSVEDDLTERFLSAAARLLDRNGIAAFVVNRQIMLERRAASRFRRIQTLAEDGSFKLVLLADAKTGA